MKKAMILITCLGLSACAGPKVRYEELDGKPDLSGKTKFQLADSTIIFAFGKNDQGALDPSKMAITSAPTPDTSHTYAVEGTDWYQNWGLRTDINAVHATDSTVLKQLGVTVTDQIAAVSGDIASAAAAVITFLPSGQLGVGAAAPPATPKEPDGIVISRFLKDDAGKCSPDRGGNLICTGFKLTGGGYPVGDTLQPYIADFTIGALPRDAVPKTSIKDGKEVSLFPLSTNSFIYSACRPFIIQVKSPVAGNPVVGRATLMVADTSAIQTLAIPPNGKVVAAATCGADATAGDYTPPDFFKDSAAVLKAAKDIKDAIKGSGATKP